VRRGRDLETGEVVAVKCYRGMESLDVEDPFFNEDRDFFIRKFVHEVRTFQQLHAEQDLVGQIQIQRDTGKQCGQRSSWFVPEGLSFDGCALMGVFADLPSSDDLFIRLIDFSRDKEGRPAPDEDGVCYIVLELAECTLEECIEDLRQCGGSFTSDQVFTISLQLAQIVTLLHAKQFVHCDLKPSNVMRFPSGRWKLIDMDGMVTTGQATTAPLSLRHASSGNSRIWM